LTDGDNERISYLAGEPVESLSPSERTELDALRGLLSSPETWDEPDPALEDRVVAAIAEEARAHPRVKAAPARRRGWRERFAMHRPLYAFGAVATAAAAAIVIAVAVNNSSPSPLRFAMVVSGTPLAPGAHGSGTLTKTASGWEIKLSATGLPHLANGRYYQAWLKNPAGILVPVGTFNDARSVTLWSGVPVTQFRTFTVTEQLANGNPASSGRRVLVGIAHPVS